MLSVVTMPGLNDEAIAQRSEGGSDESFSIPYSHLFFP